ncbi:MAG: XdhC family protein [Gammaproteobacteria bacterium]|nr:XdhC family protein [Gammaproteobacteria bacterium]
MHYDTDREILHQACRWLSAGQRVALVTVARTWGSSPRPAGSLLLMRADGIHLGSVSGGCVEEDLVRRYKHNQLATGYPTVVDYGVDHQQASRLGLPCGGRLELVIEQLDDPAPLQLLLEKIQRGELVTRRVCLRSGEVNLHPAGRNEEFSYNNNELRKVFGPNWHMLLIGAGHLSQYVAQLGVMLNYHVILCDPREEYQHTWTNDAVAFTSAMPDDAVLSMAQHPRSIVLALTHDPKLDDMALMQALTQDIFYVGALGSRRNNMARRERLLKIGVNPKQLEKLHAPVGLPIGSHTPPEIAVAILAEITATRHQVLLKTRDLLLYG